MSWLWYSTGDVAGEKGDRADPGVGTVRPTSFRRRSEPVPTTTRAQWQGDEDLVP